MWFSPPPQGLLRDEKCQGHLIIHPVALIQPGICYIQTHLPSPPPTSAQALMGWGNPREQQAAPQGQAGTAQLSPSPTSRLGRGRWARRPSVLRQALRSSFQGQVGQVWGL